MATGELNGPPVVSSWLSMVRTSCGSCVDFVSRSFPLAQELRPLPFPSALVCNSLHTSPYKTDTLPALPAAKL